MQYFVFSETQYCSSYNVGMIRLGRGGENGTALEVCVNNVFGLFCVTDSWDDNAAVVTCRQLGYETGGINAVRSSVFLFFNNQSMLHMQFHLFPTLKTHLSICQKQRCIVLDWNRICWASVILTINL